MAKTKQDKLAGTQLVKSTDMPGDDHLVWDLPLRLFHWMLVICVFGAIGSAKAEVLEVHRHFGMAVMGLICFRLIWGVVGMLMAAPIVAILKVIFERFSITKPVAEIMAGRFPTLDS